MSAPEGSRRLLIVVLLLVALALAAHFAHASEHLSVTRVRALVESSGTFGVLVFLLAFTAGELVHVPGLVFVGVAVICWGRPLGGAIAYGAALASLSISFVVVRGAAGEALAAVERPWLEKALGHVDRRPVLAIAVLRTVFVLSPPLNYALALSRVGFRDYLVGSAVGLLLPIGLAVVFFDSLVRFLPA